MKRLLIAIACLAYSVPCLAQNADGPASDEPATKDDVILYLRTMRSHDMVQRMMAVQAQSTEQLMHDQMEQKGAVPADFDARMKKVMDDMIKNVPIDDVVLAMIPAYQKHFTHGDIEAMNTFYASPVGQKVLQELPAVTQEGMQAAMPILTKYLGEWQGRLKQELDPEQSPPAKAGSGKPQN